MRAKYKLLRLKYMYKCNHASYAIIGMYAPHHRHQGLGAEYENRLRPSGGLGEDFQDFRAYLGAKTTHQIGVEAAAAAYKEAMGVHIDKNYDLSLDGKKLKNKLRLLSMDLDAKTDLMNLRVLPYWQLPLMNKCVHWRRDRGRYNSVPRPCRLCKPSALTLRECAKITISTQNPVRRL